MAKSRGSLTLGLDNISTEEALIMIKCIRNQNKDISPEEAMATLGFFDDCFSLLRVRSISLNFRRTAKGNIRKNSAFSDLISNRLDHFIEEIKEIRGVVSLVEEEVDNA